MGARPATLKSDIAWMTHETRSGWRLRQGEVRAGASCLGWDMPGCALTPS